MIKYFIIYTVGTIIVLLSAILAFYLYARAESIINFSQKKSHLPIVLLCVVLYILTFSIMKDLTVLSHHSYYDFTVFIDCFNNFANGNGLFSSMENNLRPGSGNWLSVHFTPIAYFFAILFKYFPSFHAINWAHTIILSLSPVILYQLAKPRIGSFSALCISIALLLNPTFQYITLHEFGYLRFILPIGIFALGLILATDSAVTILLACLSILLIREDTAFFVFGIGLYLLFVQRKRSIGAFVAVFSVLYLIVIIQFVMPVFRDAGNYAHVAAGSFSDFGTTVPDIIGNIFQQPLKFLAHLFHPYKSANYFMLLLPFSFIPLFSITILLIAMPTAMLLSFGSGITFSSYFLYYVSPILVAMTWAAVIGMKNIVRWVNRKERLRDILARRSPITVERVAFSVLCGAVACSVYFGPSPLSIQFWNKDFSLAPFRTYTFYRDRYRPTSHDAAMRKVARLIPDDASISTEQVLLHDVYRCKSIYVFPNIEKADYVLIDKKNPRKAYISDNPQRYYDLVEKRPDIFELIKSEDGVQLYLRRPDAPPYPQPYGTS